MHSHPSLDSAASLPAPDLLPKPGAASTPPAPDGSSVSHSASDARSDRLSGLTPPASHRAWPRARSCAAETALPGPLAPNHRALAPRHDTVDNFEAVADGVDGVDGGCGGDGGAVAHAGEDDGVVIRGVGARLAKLLLLSDTRDVRRAHLCADLDLHVSAAAAPAWDCGFRNAATLISALLPDAVVGAALRRAGLFDAPGVDEVAERIQRAWAAGYDADAARQYLGDPRGKWIGGTEVAVLLHSLGVRARVMGFETKGAIQRARMMDWVFRYFEDRCGGGRCLLHGGRAECVVPPLFLQWEGHSVVVVGAERTWKGETRLLVLDPVSAFAENFAARSVRAKMMVVRRGECHPQMVAERFQVVFLDRNPVLREEGLGNGKMVEEKTGEMGKGKKGMERKRRKRGWGRARKQDKTEHVPSCACIPRPASMAMTG